MSVKVFGFVPDDEIGEVPFDSAIYDITYDDSGKPQFLIWNPYITSWAVVRHDQVRPLQTPPQDIFTKRKMEDFKRLEAVRRGE